jgi:hypothetical protein
MSKTIMKEVATSLRKMEGEVSLSVARRLKRLANMLEHHAKGKQNGSAKPGG